MLPLRVWIRRCGWHQSRSILLASRSTSRMVEVDCVFGRRGVRSYEQGGIVVSCLSDRE